MPRDDLEQVFRAEYARVVVVAHRVLGDEQAAEDVAQEVFLEFAASRSDAVPGPRAAGWLTVAATHRALNALRGGRRRSAREERAATDPALSAGSTPDVAEDVVRDEERSRVRGALANLPAMQASVLVLRHSGLSYADIAEALGVPVTGVGTTLRRAEAALRKELIRDGSRG